MVYYNPHITGQYNPLYNLNNQGFFHCSLVDASEIPFPTTFWIGGADFNPSG